MASVSEQVEQRGDETQTAQGVGKDVSHVAVTGHREDE